MTTSPYAVRARTASIVGLVGVRSYAAYSATKGAVVALTRAMAVDLAPLGIRVNAICPGLVRTPMGDGVLRLRGAGYADTGADLTVGRYPLGRLGVPEDVAAAPRCSSLVRSRRS